MGMLFDNSVLVVLTTAPAGLGHVRVMEALRSGLSPKTRCSIMGLSDPSLQWIHRLTSRNRVLKQMMEFVQTNVLAERIFSTRYRKYLRNHTQPAVKELLETISVAWPQPETVVIVATHFGLAHQLAAAKPILSKKLGVKLVTAVIVTDDSPQEMWAVGGVDVIFVPSNTTREHLLGHLLKSGDEIPEVVTIPYPVSMRMREKLSLEEEGERLSQLGGKELKLMIPISGAAVQLDYYQDLIRVLTTDGIRISVVSRDSAYTHQFVDWCRHQQNVNVLVGKRDGEVVEGYEREYMLSVIGAEVTKPSEQAFKALYTPKERGGAVLLLSPPVGRQERDNLAFLRRHRMIPSVDDQARINEWVLYGNRIHITAQLLERAHHWRGVLLPEEGVAAAIAIKRLVEAGILQAMGDFNGFLEGHEEIRSDGVKEVWEKINSIVNVD